MDENGERTERRSPGEWLAIVLLLPPYAAWTAGTSVVSTWRAMCGQAAIAIVRGLGRLLHGLARGFFAPLQPSFRRFFRILGRALVLALWPVLQGLRVWAAFADKSAAWLGLGMHGLADAVALRVIQLGDRLQVFGRIGAKMRSALSLVWRLLRSLLSALFRPGLLLVQACYRSTRHLASVIRADLRETLARIRLGLP